MLLFKKVILEFVTFMILFIICFCLISFLFIFSKFFESNTEFIYIIIKTSLFFLLIEFLNSKDMKDFELNAGLDLRLMEMALAVDNKEIFNLVSTPEPSGFLVSLREGMCSRW